MVTRITIVGQEKEFLKSLQDAAADHNIEIAPWEAGKPLPLGTAMVAGSNEATGALLEAAQAAAGQLTTLYELLADAIDSREDIPLGTTRRLRNHTARFGEVLGLPTDERIILEHGALLHDVGKLRVPNIILLKKSVLDYDEWQTLQAHTTMGAEMVDERGLTPEIKPIVHYHHENWDGTGYPDGLEKEDIPYHARIMKLLDVFCAMTSPRLYRKVTYTVDEAYEALKSERGKNFDPNLVDAFLEADIGKAMAEADGE